MREISESDYGVTVLDATGSPIFSHSKLSYDMATGAVQGHRIREVADDFLIISTDIPRSDWTVYHYTPLANVSQSIRDVVLAVHIAFFATLIIFGVLAYVFASRLVAPLIALTKNMRQIQQGEFSVTVSTNRNDEVGILIRSFDNAMSQIRYLFDVVYKNESQQKELQIALLRAKINPHFLYNTLSLINSRAILSEEDDISQIVLLLTSFFRTALNNGNEMTTVENELNNIKSYVSLQQLLCNYEFRVKYNLDEQAMAYEIPNFILQPIVENAINHGLRNCDKKGLNLTVDTKSDEKSVTLLVADNGVGMEKNRIESLLSNQSDGYGIKNINERLQLLYGDEYRIKIKSSVDVGTSINITIPK